MSEGAGWAIIVDGYIRVSHVGGRSGERFISPGAQREQIVGWARLHRAAVGRVFEELDESGARADRPLLEEAIGRVEAGVSDGIVVAKLDRFGRSLVDSLAAIERIQAAGGLFASVQDGLDLSTDTGKLVLRIMFSMAEWELDRVRSGWDIARSRAIARGVYVSAFPPAAYIRGADGRLKPDPGAAPAMGEAFRLRADRASLRQVSHFLNDKGVVTPFGNRWSPSSVRRLFSNRAYLGEARNGRHVNRHAHSPLIDPATWQKAQLATLELSEARRTSHPSLLGGVLRCWGCRMSLSSQRHCRRDGRPFRTYACHRLSSAGRCPEPAMIAASLVEPYVEALFWQELRRGPGAEDVPALLDAQAKADEAEAALARYLNNQRVFDAVGEDRFVAGLRSRKRRVELALLNLAAVRSRSDLERTDADKLLVSWPDLSVRERRAHIGRVIDCIFVKRGMFDVEERLFVCLRGEAPVDLPRPGRRGRGGKPPLPFDPDECGRRSARLAPMPQRKRWSRRRLRAELEHFITGMECWPTHEEFQVAGRLTLLEQVVLAGGPQRWAKEVGIRYRPNVREMPDWTQERIRATLREALRGRSEWPTVQEFRDAGYGRLRKAINENGGATRWAAEFGLPIGRSKGGAHRFWTDALIEHTLAGFLEGRETWPTKEEFYRAKLSGLYHAMRGHRGIDGWATNFGYVLVGRYARRLEPQPANKDSHRR